MEANETVMVVERNYPEMLRLMVEVTSCRPLSMLVKDVRTWEKDAMAICAFTTDVGSPAFILDWASFNFVLASLRALCIPLIVPWKFIIPERALVSAPNLTADIGIFGLLGCYREILESGKIDGFQHGVDDFLCGLHSFGECFKSLGV